MSEQTTTTTPPAGAPGEGAASAAAATEPAAAVEPGSEVAELRGEMIRDRFDAAAARAGVDGAYVDVTLALFQQSGQEPSKANMSAFIESLKKSKPALFGPQPASTAPTPQAATPAAPAPGAVSNPYQQWQALRAAGRKAEAEAYYHTHRRAIQRAAHQ